MKHKNVASGYPWASMYSTGSCATSAIINRCSLRVCLRKYWKQFQPLYENIVVATMKKKIRSRNSLDGATMPFSSIYEYRTLYWDILMLKTNTLCRYRWIDDMYSESVRVCVCGMCISKYTVLPPPLPVTPHGTLHTELIGSYCDADCPAKHCLIMCLCCSSETHRVIAQTTTMTITNVYLVKPNNIVCVCVRQCPMPLPTKKQASGLTKWSLLLFLLWKICCRRLSKIFFQRLL